MRLEDGVGFVDDDLVLPYQGLEGVHVGEQTGLALPDEADVLVGAGVDPLPQQGLGHAVPLLSAAHEEGGDV